MRTLSNALALTILHSLWEGAAVAAALLAALGVIRSSRARYAAACAAMLAMAAGFTLTLMHFAPAQYTAKSAVMLSQAAGAGDGLISVVPAGFNPQSVLPWLAPLWIAGVILFHLYSISGWMLSRRLTHRGVCAAPDQWSRRVDQLRRQIHLPKQVTLLESCVAAVPLVTGLLRPVILMPAGMLSGLPANQVEAILLHELAHVRRYDYLVNLIATALEGFLFYHPAVWWISRVIHSERENCCDDFVIANTGDTRNYVSALAALEQGRWAANPALAASGGSLIRRIRRLVNPTAHPHAVWNPWISAAALAVGAAVTLAAWQAPSSAQTPIATSWEKWASEDVAYIITDEERQAFRMLTTDADREHFVEQFWLRRDPTPGTPLNEFKEEIYRRIAYVNAHFGSSVPGWKTDRGRIYITFGPPDEIDAHPSGGVYTHPAAEGGAQVVTFPFEQWRYRFIEGIGNNVKIDFVDKAMSGEYRMTRDPAEKDR